MVAITGYGADVPTDWTGVGECPEPSQAPMDVISIESHGLRPRGLLGYRLQNSLRHGPSNDNIDVSDIVSGILSIGVVALPGARSRPLVQGFSVW